MRGLIKAQRAGKRRNKQQSAGKRQTRVPKYRKRRFGSARGRREGSLEGLYDGIDAFPGFLAWRAYVEASDLGSFG